MKDLKEIIYTNIYNTLHQGVFDIITSPEITKNAVTTRSSQDFRIHTDADVIVGDYRRVAPVR